MSKAKGPAWLRAYVAHCRAAFGLDRPGFELRVVQVDTVDSTDPDVSGDTTTSARYGRACVTLTRSLAPDSWGYEILTHELLHAASGAQRQAVNRILELVPEPLRDHAEELWQDGNEATITYLARGLVPVLRASLPTEETPTDG